MRYPQHLPDPNQEQRAIAMRVLTIFGVVVVLMVVLLARMTQLQVLQHARYATISEDNRIQLWPVPPTRGRIMDRNGRLLADNAPVFRSRKGGHLDESMVWRIVRKASKRAGIDKDVSCHWLRHAHASHALDRGAPIHLVQACLGHASISSTGKYLHARPTDSSANYLPVG